MLTPGCHNSGSGAAGLSAPLCADGSRCRRPRVQFTRGAAAMTDATTTPTVSASPGRLAAVGRFLARRMGEMSTYRGAMLVLTAIGVAIRPETAEAITAFGLAVAGLIGVLFPDTTQPVQ